MIIIYFYVIQIRFTFKVFTIVSFPKKHPNSLLKKLRHIQKMGDSITDLSVDKKLDISENDMNHIYKFFNVDLSQEEMQKEGGGNKSLTEIFQFVGLFAIVFYLCIPYLFLTPQYYVFQK